MLVLTRKREEQIIIGPSTQETIITVVELRGDKVRIGIDAPRDVPVHRKEVADAIKEQQGKCAQMSPAWRSHD